MLVADELDRAVAALKGSPRSPDLANEVYRLALHANDEEAGEYLASKGPAQDGVTLAECVVRNNLVGPACPNVVEVANTDELAATLKASHAFKAAGDGWGYSGAAYTDGTLVFTADALTGVLPLNVDELAAGENPQRLCRFRPGTTIAQLDEALAKRGQALLNGPGFEGLTFLGTALMGGSGSGVWLGPLADQIRSLELVIVNASGEAEKLRLEPLSHPLTTTTGADVLRDDACFHAARVGLGLLGVVTSAVIEVGAAGYLEETRTRRSWRWVVDNLDDLLTRQGPRGEKELHSAEVWVNPYRKRKEKGCVVGTRAWSSRTKPQGQRGLGVRVGSKGSYRLISWIMRTIPSAVPVLLDAALALTTAEGVHMPSHEALRFGAPNRAEVVPGACAIPFETAADIDTSLRQLFDQLELRRRRDHAYVSSPIGLRFVGASTAPLSPFRGRRSCLIEMPLLKGTPHEEDTLEFALEHLQQTLGRPHWGQRHSLDAQSVRQLYGGPAVDLFLAARRRLDPTNRLTNRLSDRLGLSAAKPTPNDVVAGAPRAAWSRLFRDASPRVLAQLLDTDPVGVIADLAERGRAVVLSAGGNSLHTQGLSGDGRAYLDTAPLLSAAAQVARDQATIAAGAATPWRVVVARALAAGRVPRVVPTLGDITVGGSLAVNAIGQASRFAGHELDGVRQLTVIVPGDTSAASDDRRARLIAIDPKRAGGHEPLLRAVVGGYGQVGVITGARYELDALPKDPRAITTVRRFEPGDASGPIGALRRTDANDRDHRSCTFFLAGVTGMRWAGTVLRTHFGSATANKRSLLSYEGDTPRRRIAERLLTFMPTAELASRVADHEMRRASKEKLVYQDRLEGFLFLMQPNHDHKKRMKRRVAANLAPTLQQTWVVPDADAQSFLEHAFSLLAAQRALDGERAEIDEVLATLDDDTRAELITIEGHARRAAKRLGDLGGPSVMGTAAEEQLVRDAVERLLGFGGAVPALFEMVWIPADEQYLSSTYGHSGYAISMTFQGPGVDPDAPIAQLPIVARLHRRVRALLDGLTSRCEQLGGRLNLSKNVFLPPSPGASDAERMQAWLRKRPGSVEGFEAARTRYDPRHLLGSRFTREVLGF